MNKLLICAAVITTGWMIASIVSLGWAFNDLEAQVVRFEQLKGEAK